MNEPIMLMPRMFVAAAVVLACAGASPATGHSQGRRPLHVTVTPAAAQPGDVVRVAANGEAADGALTLSALGQDVPLHFDAERHEWRTLLGVDLDTKPAVYPLRVRRRSDDEVALTSLQVRAKQFPIRRLRVAPRFVEPSAEALRQITSDNLSIADAYARTTAPQWIGPAVWPVEGQPSSNFGARSYYNRVARAPHSGVDFSAATGTPVAAPLGGTVALASSLYFTGNTVILDHGARLFSILAHLSEIHVTVDQPVDAGTIVGLSGATGRVTGPHLHWGVRLGGARVDPLSLVAATRE